MIATGSLERGASIDASGVATHYHEAGSGSTIVFVHGSGPGVSAWANWRRALPVLAERFHVVAPDLLGFGSSARATDAAYGLDVWVGHLIAFLAAKGIARAHVVGNSMGGAVALALAARRPDLVERLVLMGSCGVPFPITAGLDAVWGYEPDPETMRRLIADAFAFDPAIATDDLVRLRYEASRAPGAHESYAQMFPAPRQRWVDALATPEEAIRRIAHPVLLVHGRDDRVIPVAVSQRLFELLPNGQLHLFSRCGHWTQIEHADAFHALVAAFLSSR